MSRPPALAVLGYSGAAMFLRRVPASDIAGVISIHGHREFGVEADVACRLDLTFDDVEVAPPGDVQAIERVMARKRWAEQNGLFEVAPTPEDVAAIIRFAEIVRGTSGTLLCHCGGGMSRAGRVVDLCCYVARARGGEGVCGGGPRVTSGAMPHAGMIRFADELLGRKGRLVALWPR